jgi:L,D-transpeptidase-like protein
MRRAATILVAAVASACVLAGAGFGLSRSGLAARLMHGRQAHHAQQAYPVQPGTEQLVMSGPHVTSSAPAPPVLTPAERHACPAAAAACVDLKAHLTWLQSHGRPTFGPVRMEPGTPGTASATPSGTFHVEWKAGPHFVSSEYGDPMPWATFFAPGGVAFHGGSLTQPSHGCVHLTSSNAHFFQVHLPIGAEVVVF